MDEFGSPISGGIRAVRRNISSSFLGASQNSQPDTVTTDLLQEQSLKLTSVSGQLQNISRQVATLDFNLKSVKENLALGDQLERQREAAKQNRERILAEQGLREGKESALENKIQSSLAQPLQKIGVKTQGILSQLTNFLFTLAGGWLTVTGIDLLQAMAEGNVDKINRLKTKFLVGLTVILGSLTAIKIGMKKVLGILAVFSGNVAKIAFGGIFKAALTGVKILLAGLVKKAALLTAGVLTAGGIGGFLTRILADYLGFKALGSGGRIIKKTFSKTLGRKINPRQFQNRPLRNIKKIINPNASKTGIFGRVRNFFQGTEKFQSVPPKLNTQKFFSGSDPTMAAGQLNKPVSLGRSGGLFGRAKGLLNRGKNLLDDGVRAVSKTGIVSKAKNLTKGLPKVGFGKLLGKALGPFITFFSELLSEDGGLMSALAATAGFMAGAKVGAIAGGAIGALFGGVGAAPGAFIGALIGGFAGESVMKNLSKKIMNALGMKDIKVFNRDKKEGDEVEAIKGNSENITPTKNNNLDAANKISDFSENDTEFIMAGSDNSVGGFQDFGGVESTSSSKTTIPSIHFDKQNPHTHSTTSVLGVSD